MIPLRDLQPTRITPVLTLGIIAVNVLVFIATFGDLDGAARAFGAVPYHFTGAEPDVLTFRHPRFGAVSIDPVPKDTWFPIRVLTHMWLHGGLLHILGNMWFLWVFGDNIEERLGRARYLGIYLGAGLVALLAQVVANPSSGLPMVGASGAVSGVLGAYLRFYPNARIVTLVPLGFLLLTQLWSAKIFLGIWIGLQILRAAMDDGVGGGVAWWAHIGGFALGYLLAPVLAPRERRIEVETGRPPRRGPFSRWDRPMR